MADEVHVGDIGTVLRVTVQDEDAAIVDISAASTKQILIKKPNGTLLTKTAAFTTDGTDGQMQYTTVGAVGETPADLDVAGDYKIQGYVVIGTGAWKTSTHIEHVHKNLSA